ncbi:ferric reductase-like transmembrane domain-containing protein [Dyella sp. C9]|uniref:ferredoxin reductase family protein n=1 Tax=Dyella sp. C9 TaxID=2202154 RepID=UPI0018E58236|nr:ferredoxin reductase family protein [Dyella sp. C9]
MIRNWQVVGLPIMISVALVAWPLPVRAWPTTGAISLAAGVAALSMMGLAAVLSARLGVVESLFGGLDRVYQAHKWLGIWALGLGSFHLVFHAGVQGVDNTAILPLPRDLTHFVRQVCFVGLMFIVLLALNRNIPYRVWRWWHKLSGPLFMVVVLHWLSIKSPIALGSPSGLWLALTASAGVLAATYKLLLYRFVTGQAEYRVVAVTPGKAAIHLELEPVGRPLSFEPGQFGFLRMKADGLREPHPFTIASGNGPNGRVDFVIRALGDFTGRLVADIRVGMVADILAPHGRFVRDAQAGHEVWIGGGVGISPFIAWLKDDRVGHFDRVTLFYFYTPGREFPEVAVLQAMAEERGAAFVAVPDGPVSDRFRQRFDAIARNVGVAAVKVAFCGPPGLLHVIRAQMREQGLPASSLRYEYFNFR